MAHSKEAHATKAAMPQFNEGHWEKKLGDVTLADGKYNRGEFSQEAEYKESVNKLAGYAKRHKVEH